MARLLDEYNKRVKGEIMKEQGYSNMMEVPTLSKIVINIGAGEAVTNKKALSNI